MKLSDATGRILERFASSDAGRKILDEIERESLDNREALIAERAEVRDAATAAAKKHAAIVARTEGTATAAAEKFRQAAGEHRRAIDAMHGAVHPLKRRTDAIEKQIRELPLPEQLVAFEADLQRMMKETAAVTPRAETSDKWDTVRDRTITVTTGSTLPSIERRVHAILSAQRACRDELPFLPAFELEAAISELRANIPAIQMEAI